MHARKRHIVWKGAMAGYVDSAVYPLHLDVMSVEDVGKLFRDRLQSSLKMRIAFDLLTRFDGGGLAFNMSEDRSNFRNLLTNFKFQQADQVMSLLERQLLVHFKMLFDMQAPVKILNAHVVNVHVMAGGDGAHAVENVLCGSCSWNRVDHDIRIRKQAVDSASDFIRDLAGALESNVAGEADGDIGKVAITGAPDPYTINLQQALDAFESFHDLVASADWRSIQQGVDRTARQAGANEHNYCGYKQRSHRIGGN